MKKLVKFVTPKFVEAKARRLLTRMSLCIQTPLPLSLFRQPYYTQIPKPLLCVHQIEENHITGEFTFKICIKILTIRGWLVINRSISIWGLAQLTCRSSFLVFFTEREKRSQVLKSCNEMKTVVKEKSTQWAEREK